MTQKSIPSVYLLVLAVIFALAAAVTGVKFINKYVSAVPVVTMAVDKPAFTKIEPSDVRIIQVSKSAIQKGMFSGIQPVVGKYSRTFIPAGTILSRRMLAENDVIPDSETEEGRADEAESSNPLGVALTELKKPGLRAYTIPVDQIQGLGGYIVPGDKVDVTGAMKLPIGVGASEQPVAKTIVRGRTVLGTVKNSGNISGVTIALSPQEAQDIIFALLNGRVSVGLNPYESDQNASDTQTTTAHTFIQKYINGIPSKSSTSTNSHVIPANQ